MLCYVCAREKKSDPSTQTRHNYEIIYAVSDLLTHASGVSHGLLLLVRVEWVRMCPASGSALNLRYRMFHL